MTTIWLLALALSAKASTNDNAQWLCLKLENIVPLQRAQDIQAFTLGFGKRSKDMNDMEILFSGLVKQTIDTQTQQDFAWAGSIQRRQSMSWSKNVDAFISLRAGFIAADRVSQDEKNLYYPFLQVGFGMRFQKHISKETFVSFLPELGVIPAMPYNGEALGVAAPTLTLSMSMGQSLREPE